MAKKKEGRVFGKCECGGAVRGVKDFDRWWTWCEKCTPVVKISTQECYEGQIERLRCNHKDVVETKRRTDARLKWALAGLQRIYNESSDSRMAEIAGEAFERATSEVSPSVLDTP